MASTQAPPAHDDIAKLAYRLWHERGASIGSPEVDRDLAEERERLAASPPAATSAPDDPDRQPSKPRAAARQRAEHDG